MVFLSLLFYCFSFFSPEEKTGSVESITLKQLQARVIQPQNDTLYIVNFWATWCKPCVEELPYFEEAGKNYAGKNVKILLINLDFASEKEKVGKFVQKKNLQNQVYMLNEGNPNHWIDKVEPSWDGAIPATIMYRNGQKVFFHEGDLSQAELNSIIQTKNP